MMWLIWSACVAPISEPWSGSTVTTTTAPSGDPPTGLSIVSIGYACSESSNGWEGAAETDAWTTDASFTMYRASTVTYEEHPMPLTATDPQGWWDRRQIGPLAAGVPVEEQEDGVSSQFGCAEDPELTFFVQVWDVDGVLADCGMWGADTDSGETWLEAHSPGVAAIGGCRPWQ